MLVLMFSPSSRILIALVVYFVITSYAQAHSETNSLTENPARGMVFGGLHKATSGPCKGLFKIDGLDSCTHGPDPAPAGVDVRKFLSTAEIINSVNSLFTRSSLNEPGTASSRQSEPFNSPATPVSGVSQIPSDNSGAIICEGDGVSGNRIQVLYVRSSKATDRFAQVESTIGKQMIRADSMFNRSARKNGASRHLRFATRPNGNGCVLDTIDVTVAPSAMVSIGATIAAVKEQGYNKPDRHYMMMGDARVMCGLGDSLVDSRYGQDNENNGGIPFYARVDAQCWEDGAAIGHELMHTMGGVQPDAPNATPRFHCTDGSDAMCYDEDDTSMGTAKNGTPTNGPIAMRKVCPDSQANIFDCNSDDYFNAGQVPANNYLATHWNTARSSFLIATAPAPTPSPSEAFTRFEQYRAGELISCPQSGNDIQWQRRAASSIIWQTLARNPRHRVSDRDVGMALRCIKAGQPVTQKTAYARSKEIQTYKVSVLSSKRVRARITAGSTIKSMSVSVYKITSQSRRKQTVTNRKTGRDLTVDLKALSSGNYVVRTVCKIKGKSRYALLPVTIK